MKFVHEMVFYKVIRFCIRFETDFAALALDKFVVNNAAIHLYVIGL